MTKKLVQKHLDEIVAIEKGDMDRNWKKFKSTRVYKIKDTEPEAETKISEVFVAYLTTNTDSVAYTDLTSKFPITSLKGNKYILVICHYDTNAILVKPLKNRSDSETLAVYNEIHNDLQQWGFKIKLYIIENETSKALKRQIQKENTECQLVEPQNHRVNVVERSM